MIYTRFRGFGDPGAKTNDCKSMVGCDEPGFYLHKWTDGKSNIVKDKYKQLKLINIVGQVIFDD